MIEYVSTREGRTPVSAAQAIVKGISGEGGLFVPALFPPVSLEEIGRMASMSYQERARMILMRYLTDFSEEEIARMVQAAYSEPRFDVPQVAPLIGLEDGRQVLELWHGPTSAFKDMALQLLPHLMTASARKLGESQEIVILVATSGDTGKAALEGFADVEGVRCVVFYPKGGVSEAQRLQMVTQEGSNTAVIAVHGNFDDAQTGVKRIFADPAAARQLHANHRRLSSANSINWGRLVPQVVYYFSAYADLVRSGAAKLGQPVNFVVPTGNFGNILAAVYARSMGLPVGRLVCASNRNNVLTDFIHTGMYDARRSFYLTSSPSMDILISSNLERMLFEVSGRDAGQVCAWMASLKDTGRYQVTGQALERLQALIWGGWADDGQVSEEIARTWQHQGYLTDPHTAVAFNVHRQYVEATGDTAPSVIVSTASPFKFGRVVAGAVMPDRPLTGLNDFACCELLSGHTGWRVPPAIAALPSKPVRHSAECDPGDMLEALMAQLPEG